jgi:hypothetical protein
MKSPKKTINDHQPCRGPGLDFIESMAMFQLLATCIPRTAGHAERIRGPRGLKHIDTLDMLVTEIHPRGTHSGVELKRLGGTDLVR